MHPRTSQKLKNLVVALLVVGGVGWWQQGRIRYFLGLGGSLDSGVTSAVQSLGQSRERGDYQALLGMMSSEYQKGRLGEIDRMKAILVSGTEAEKQEVRKQLAQLGLTEADLTGETPQELAAKLVRADVEKHPEMFPTVVQAVDEIRIERNVATVTVKIPSGGRATLQFVKEGGVWKLNP